MDSHSHRRSSKDNVGLGSPSYEELSDSIAAIKAAHADLEAGDLGEPARVLLRNTCCDLGLVIEE